MTRLLRAGPGAVGRRDWTGERLRDRPQVPAGSAFGVVGQDPGGFSQEGHGFDQVQVEQLPQGLGGFRVRIELTVILPQPVSRPVEGGFGFLKSGFGSIDRATAIADGFGLLREPRGEEFLFGLGQLVCAQPDLLLPMGCWSCSSQARVRITSCRTSSRI
jgi:hypothetical protein